MVTAYPQTDIKAMPTPTSSCTSLATMKTGIVFVTVVALVACATLADHHTEKKIGE
jgi:hypothetical protein